MGTTCASFRFVHMSFSSWDESWSPLCFKSVLDVKVLVQMGFHLSLSYAKPLLSSALQLISQMNVWMFKCEVFFWLFFSLMRFQRELENRSSWNWVDVKLWAFFSAQCRQKKSQQFCQQQKNITFTFSQTKWDFQLYFLASEDSKLIDQKTLK